MPLPRLPLASDPRPDELLSSWLVRLAHDHYNKVYTFCKLLLPGVNVWNRDIDKGASIDVVRTLSERTGTPVRRLQSTLLRHYEGRLYLHHNPLGNTEWILPLGIYHRTRRRYGLLFCPGCLRRDGETPYFRTRWRLALSIVCTTCKIFLHECCPQCRQPIAFFRAELGRKSALADAPISHCFHCGLDLTVISGIPAPLSVLAAQQERDRILIEGWTPSVVYPHLYFMVLRQLAQALCSKNAWCQPLQTAVAAYIKLDLEEINAERLQEARSFEHLPLAVRSVLLQQADWLLTDWPQRFVSFMKQHRIASTPLLQEMPEIPFWYHSIIQQHLYVNNVNRRFKGFWT